MKIAIDITPIHPDFRSDHKVRGVGMYITQLVENLKKYDQENEYIFFTKGQRLSGVDAVHYPYFDPYFRTIPLRKKHKVVVTVHDLIPLKFPEHFPAGKKGKLKWRVNRRSLKRADAVITDSVSAAKDVEQLIGIREEKIYPVHLAVGSEFTRIKNQELRIKSIKEKYGLPDKFLLYVGDVTWNKNLPRLARAVKQANVPLVMAGKSLVQNTVDENPWNDSFREFLSEIEGSDLFHRLGFVSSEDLVTLYNMAAVLIMPSLYEGFGLPVLEAMSCGCPVITSRSGSLPEVGGDAVYYIDAESDESITNGIREVWSDAILQSKLSAKGLEQSQKFTWEKVIKETTAVYESIYKANSL